MKNPALLPPTYLAHKIFLSLLESNGVKVKETRGTGKPNLIVSVVNARLRVIFDPISTKESFVEMDDREASLQTLQDIADFTPKLFNAFKAYQEFVTLYDSYARQFEAGPATTFTIPQKWWHFLTPTELVDITPIPKLYEIYGYETCLHGFMDLLPLEARKIAWTRTLVLVLGNPIAYDALMTYGRNLVTANAKG